MLEDLEKAINNINNRLFEITTKLSMHDSCIQIKNARFYLPNYPRDLIQKSMVNSNDYWDTYALNIIDVFLPEKPVILDIGANIGSHSVYWALEKHAKKVYSFEPLPSTFAILLYNIQLNGLENVIIPYNIGLSNKKSNASVQLFDPNNIGGTHFSADENGMFKLEKLDSVKIKEKIDLIKIDVEGMEVDVLKGAEKTIKKDKPLIVIETFTEKEKVDKILKKLGYSEIVKIRENADYIYRYGVEED